MTTDLLKAGFVAIIAFVSMGACQMVDGDVDDHPQPAVLANGEPETIEALKTALASALGRSQIELGPSDPTTSSVIMVPPPPLHPTETHSIAMPIAFKLLLKDGACIAVNEKSGEEFALEGVTCRAVE